MKDLKKFIATTIREYLNENNTKILNKSFNLTLDDVEYIYSDWDVEMLDIDEQDDLKNTIVNFMKTGFSVDSNGKLLGVENFPETIKLYRLIQVDNPNKINIDNLGIHWTLNKKTLYNDNFLGQIGISFDSDEDLYIIEGVFHKKQADIISTIIHQMSNEIENEITTYKQEKPKTYKIFKYK